MAAAATRLQDDTWYGKDNDDRTIMPELARTRDGEAAVLEMQRFFDKAIGADSLNVTPAKEQNLLAVLECIAVLHGEAYAGSARLGPPGWTQASASRSWAHSLFACTCARH